jgi:hypothetical protein
MPYIEDEETLRKLGYLPSENQATQDSRWGEPIEVYDEGILSKLKKRAGAIAEEATSERGRSWSAPVVAEKALRIAGQAAGGINDVIGAAISGAYKSIVPETTQQDIKDIATRAVTTPIAGTSIADVLKSGVETYGQFKGAYPEIAKDVEAAGNIANALPALKWGAQGVKGLFSGNRLANVAGPSYGIRTTLGEETGIPSLQRLETFAEKVPGSFMTRFRMKQHESADQAAKEFLGKYIADPFAADASEANARFINNAYEMAKQKGRAGSIMVPASNTKGEALSLIENFPDVFESVQDKRIKGVLKNIISDTKDQKVLLGPSGKELVATVTPEFSFDDLWTLRKGLGQAINDARTQTGKYQLNSLYGAVTKDMENIFSKTGTDANEAFKFANEAFKRYNLKYNAFQEAYDKASGTASAAEYFSPKTFSTNLKKIAYRDKLPLTDLEKKEVTGLANIMQVVKRAGQFKENPPTGSRFVDLALMAAVKSPALPISWATTFLTTTDKGKKLVRAAASINPNSYAMSRIMMSLMSEAPREEAEENL